MTQRTRRSIRSREERGLDAEVRRFEVGNGVPGPEGAGDDGLEEVRRLAQSHGFVLSKERRAKKARPDERNGKVRLSCNVSVAVRDAMERGRYELGMGFSEMVEIGVAMYLESMGLRIVAASPARGARPGGERGS